MIPSLNLPPLPPAIKHDGMFFKHAVLYAPSLGEHYPRRAEVPRGDHHLRDDHGRLSGAEEAPLALRGDRRSPPTEEQELQTAGGTQTHEPGESVGV